MVFGITELLEYLSKSDNVNSELIDFIKKIRQYNWEIHAYSNTVVNTDIVFFYQCPFGKTGIINITIDNYLKKILKVCCVKTYQLSKTINQNYITMDDIILTNYKDEDSKVWNEFELPTNNLEFAYDILLYCMKSIKITRNEIKKYEIRKMFDKE